MLQLIAPLRTPAYRRLWFGRTLSTLGNSVYPVALAVTILRERGVNADLGFVLTATSVGYLLSVLWAGVIADRARRRTRVLLAGEGIGLAGTVGFALISPHAPLAVLIGLAAVLGVGLSLNIPAWYGLVPRIIDSRFIPAATALSSTSAVAAGVVGPALGAVLVTTWGPRVAFGFDAATFLVAGVNLWRVDEPPAEPVAERTSLLHEAREGLHAVWRRPWIAALITQSGVQWAVMGAPLQVLVPVALERWHMLNVYGSLLAVQSAGSIAAGVVLAHRRPRHPGSSAVSGIMLVAGVFLCLALHAPLWMLGVAMLLQGTVYSMYGVLWHTALQTQVPDHLLSRFLALSEVGDALGEPAGLALAAPAVAAFGLAPVAWFGAIATVLTTLPIFAVPGVRDFRDPGKAAEPDELASYS